MSGKVKQTYIDTYIIDIFKFQNALSNLCCSTDFYHKSKTLESSHETEKCFLTFEKFFSKCTFLKLQFFFSLGTYPANTILSVINSLILFATVAMITELVSFRIFVATIVKESNSFNTIMRLINPN